MKRLEVGEVGGQGNEVSGSVWAVELEEVRPVWVVVPAPAEFSESLLELGVGPYNLIRREVDKDPGTSPRRGGGARVRWLFLLEGFPGWVADQSSDAVFAEYPHAWHGYYVSSSTCVYDEVIIWLLGREYNSRLKSREEEEKERSSWKP